MCRYDTIREHIKEKYNETERQLIEGFKEAQQYLDGRRMKEYAQALQTFQKVGHPGNGGLSGHNSMLVWVLGTGLPVWGIGVGYRPVWGIGVGCRPVWGIGVGCRPVWGIGVGCRPVLGIGIGCRPVLGIGIGCAYRPVIIFFVAFFHRD